MKKYLFLIISIVCIFQTQAQSWAQIQKATAANRIPYDYFGSYVAISSGYAVVSQGAGNLAVFKKTSNGWVYQQSLDSINQRVRGISISGDYIIVGCHEYECAYIYKQTGGIWSFQQKLTPLHPQTGGSLFGCSVAISGDYAIIGSFYDSSDASGGAKLRSSGAAYIFKQSGGYWAQQQKIVATDRKAEVSFGESVSIDGDYAIISAFNESYDANGANYIYRAGAVYFFKQTGGVWTQQQKVVASDRAIYGYFGLLGVDISGDYAIIGRTHDFTDANGNGTSTTFSGAGSAYIFHQTAGVWSQQQKIVADDRAMHDEFGSGVAIDGDYAVVLTQGDHASDAYIFHKSNGQWLQEQKIDNYYINDVDINAGDIIIGVPGDDKDENGNNPLVASGAVYFFQSSIAGISEMEHEVNSLLYPNPATNTLTITGIAPKTDITLTNLLGEVLYKTTAKTATETIDVSKLASGMYFINKQRFVKE